MRKSALIFMSVLVTFALFGCAAEKYGAGVDKSTREIRVKDIFIDNSIVGEKVTLKGSIASQCGSNGCWFVLQDDTGQIFINLAQANMTLPPRMNRKAKVTGVVYPVQGELQVIAHGVEIR